MNIIVVALPFFIGALLAGAAQPRTARVPPPGLAIPEKDRAGLRTEADALAAEIHSLRRAGQTNLLPDVEIFHKAVDWALRYDEFYRSNEVGLARGLLKTGLERAKQLRAGAPSWLTATGLVVRGYLSKIDGSVQPYGLVVPATFAGELSRPRRLDIWLHGRDNNLTELKFLGDRMKSYGEFTPRDAIVLHPYGRYCNAFKFAGETDVFEALDHVKEAYAIDERRIALRGFSMGGAGVWHLASHHPGVWAVAAPGAGFAETAQYQKLGTNRSRFPRWEQTLWQLYDATDYSANFANLPVVAYNGTLDDQRQAADVMERAMQAEDLILPRVWGTNIGHKYTPEAKRELNEFVDGVLVRGRTQPDKVHFTTRSLRYNQAPSVELLGLRKHWQRADVWADFSKASEWHITTTNVSALALSREKSSRPAAIYLDGQKLKPAFRGRDASDVIRVTVIRRPTGKWTIADLKNDLAKTPGRQGPIDDAFMGSFLIVRPTGQAAHPLVGRWTTAELAKATNAWRAQFRGDARIKNDTEVTEADIAAHNLVLFGDPLSNKLLRRVANRLPIRWTSREVKAGPRTFPAETHAPVFIFPNPLNPKRYIVVNSGFTFSDAGAASNARQTPKLPDYAVVNLEQSSVVLADFFDEQWQIE